MVQIPRRQLGQQPKNPQVKGPGILVVAAVQCPYHIGHKATAGIPLPRTCDQRKVVTVGDLSQGQLGAVRQISNRRCQSGLGANGGVKTDGPSHGDHLCCC